MAFRSHSFFGEVSVDVDVSVDDVLCQVGDDALISYLEGRGSLDPLHALEENPVEAYFHGDFDLVKFIKSVGAKNVEKALEEIKTGS